jgi:serine/threonine protein phosphatase PrpC
MSPALEAGSPPPAASRSAVMKVHGTMHGVAREPGRTTQDAFRMQQRDGTLIAALADGLGAARQGGAAAQRAVEMMTDYFIGRPRAWSARRALTEFAAQINRVFFQESQLMHGGPELLCTLSTVAIEGGMLYGLNVGDSPIFLARRGALRRLSEEHVRPEEGMEHVLTKAIGAVSSLEPHIFETPVENGDTIVLCSDGVSTPLSVAKLTELFTRPPSARTLVSAAVQIAADRAELQDDASAIVIDILERGWPSTAGDRAVEVLPTLRAGDSIDDFRLVRPLQEGNRVWLAERADGTRRVLKFFPLETRDDEIRRDAFIREAWQASRVSSDDFVRAEIPTEGSLRYYSMEYVEAPTLHELLGKAALGVEEVIALGTCLLRATQELLRHEIAHGDIKPENILVERGAAAPRFKLLDLGSAAEIFSVTSRAGTASYLAPERFQGSALSERTEIFAIGVTLYRALSRAFPYGEIERYQTPRFEATPRRLTRINPSVPPWLDAVIMRAIAPEPERRYQHFSEMAYELEHPDQVQPYYRKDAPLLERNPLLFYKLLCAALGVLCAVLAWRLLEG